MVADISHFFDFSRWRLIAILDFQIPLISTADELWRSQIHHHAKFDRNMSSSCGDIAIKILLKYCTDEQYLVSLLFKYFMK